MIDDGLRKEMRKDGNERWCSNADDRNKFKLHTVGNHKYFVGLKTY